MSAFTQSRATGHPIADLSRRLSERLRQRRDRRALRRITDLDDHLLRDIGVTRAEVELALSAPLTLDAGTELRRLANERRRVEMSRLAARR